MSRKSASLAFQGYTPGPDGATVQQTFLTKRVRSGMPIGAPVQQFTPDQAYFRGSIAAGRWQSDGPAHGYITRMTHDPATGCADTLRMEPCSRPGAPDYYADLGGKGAVDYAARRP